MLPISGAVRLPEVWNRPALVKLAVVVNVPVFVTVPPAELAKFAAFQVPLLKIPPAFDATSPVQVPLLKMVPVLDSTSPVHTPSPAAAARAFASAATAGAATSLLTTPTLFSAAATAPKLVIVPVALLAISATVTAPPTSTRSVPELVSVLALVIEPPAPMISVAPASIVVVPV